MNVQRMARWFVIAVTMLAVAGTVGIISLQVGIDRVHDRQARDCKTVQVLNQSISSVLDALRTDPLTPQSVRDIIARQEAVIAKSIESINSC
jgi:hypothetical protein